MSANQAEAKKRSKESSTMDRVADLTLRRQEIESAEKRALDRQHAKGKLTARERIDLLFDEGSFVEIDEFARHQCTDFGMDANRPYGDGVVTGFGTVDGRRVCVFSQDFTVLGGSMGRTSGEKMLKAMDLAVKTGCPMVNINDSAGARIQEGVDSLAYYAELGRKMSTASGVIPQISMVVGPCAGGAAYTSALSDVVVMAEKISYMFVTGPDVVEAVTGERTTFDELGGPAVSSEVAGNAHFVGADERDAISWVQTLLGHLPGNNMEESPAYEHEFTNEITEADLELDRFLPDAPNAGYDMREVVQRVVDDGDFLELQEKFARNMICGLGRVRGRSIGIVANQPSFYAGAIDIDASEKAARFVRFCDAFNIPILTLADVPGYLPGIEQERLGIIRRGAKLIYAYSEAVVPKVTVVLRKAYGGGYAVMGSKHLGADFNFAWPSAEIAVMGAAGAARVLHRKELQDLSGEARAEREAELAVEFQRKFSTPYVAAERGYVDAVIAPSQTRLRVATAFDMLRNKRIVRPAKKHGNIPL